MTSFQRFQAKYVGRTGAPVGVFVGVDHLRRAGRLSEKEIICYALADAWFQQNLPNPPFYVDENSIGAVTWFRESSDDMTARLQPLLAILVRRASYGSNRFQLIPARSSTKTRGRSASSRHHGWR